MKNIYDVIDLVKFNNSNTLAFDFSNDFDVTFVEFLNFIPNNDRQSLEERVRNFTEYLQCNYVIVVGGKDDLTYRFNLDGILGFDTWADLDQIGIFLNELLTKHRAKYIIFTGDCGGGYTALLASKNCKPHAMLLTTPAISISDFECKGFNKDQVDSYTVRHNVAQKLNHDRSTWEDLFPVLLNHVNTGMKIDIHWSTRIIKTDVYERDRVQKIRIKNNLQIFEHETPDQVNPHFLARWLFDTGKLVPLYQQEIGLGKVYCCTKDGR